MAHEERQWGYVEDGPLSPGLSSSVGWGLLPIVQSLEWEVASYTRCSHS